MVIPSFKSSVSHSSVLLVTSPEKKIGMKMEITIEIERYILLILALILPVSKKFLNTDYLLGTK